MKNLIHKFVGTGQSNITPSPHTPPKKSSQRFQPILPILWVNMSAIIHALRTNYSWLAPKKSGVNSVKRQSNPVGGRVVGLFKNNVASDADVTLPTPDAAHVQLVLFRVFIESAYKAQRLVYSTHAESLKK
jgi:hypothetical protein